MLLMEAGVSCDKRLHKADYFQSIRISKEKCTSTKILSPFFPSGYSLVKYWAVI